MKEANYTYIEGKGYTHRRFMRTIKQEDTRLIGFTSSLEEGGGYSWSIDMDRAYPEGKLFFYDKMIEVFSEGREVVLKEIAEMKETR